MSSSMSTDNHIFILYADKHHSELAREKAWARIHLTALLQAEEDRDLVRRYWADQEREKELLGKVTKVYNSDRYARAFTLGTI